MAISEESAARMMVKCGRRCCVCRRFRPTKLQVHHIVEQAKGGSDDEDNLIVICLSCHTDVHSKIPFARRFSATELKLHREALIAMVAAGSLPTNDADDTDEVIARVVVQIENTQTQRPAFSPEAVELLLKAALSENSMQGLIHFVRHMSGVAISAGGINVDADDRRSQARYQAAIDQLVQTGLLEDVSKGMAFRVTYDGYLAADELSVSAGE